MSNVEEPLSAEQFESKHGKWLQKCGSQIGAGVDWKKSEQLKSQRLGGAKQELDQIKDQLRELNKYEILIKGLLLDSTKQSLLGTEQGWKVQDEVDWGHDLGGRDLSQLDLPKEVKERIKAALDRITKIQEQLQHSMPPDSWPEVQGEFENRVRQKKQEAQEPVDEAAIREAVRKELAEEKGCSVQEIDEIQLAKNVPRADWDDIKQQMKSANEIATKAQEEAARWEKQLKKAASKPATIQEELREKVAGFKDTARIKQEAVQTLRDQLAQKYQVTAAEIEKILGWKPLFDDMALRNELWKPMVREGVIPDNIVPDQYNETVQQFRGAQDLYENRIADEYASDPERDTKENLALAKGIAKNAAAMTGDVCGLLGVFAKKGSQTAKDLELATKIAKASGEMVASLCDGIEKVQAREFEGVCDVVGKALGTCLGAALGKDQQDLSKIISGSFTTVSKSAIAAEKMFKESPPQWQDAVTALGEALEGTFTIVGAKSDDPAHKKAFEGIGKALKQGFEGVALVGAAKEALEEEPPNIAGYIDALSKSVQMLFSDVLAVIVEDTESIKQIDTSGKGVVTKEIGHDQAGDETREKMNKAISGVASKELAAAFAAIKKNPKAMAAAKKAFQQAEAEQTNKDVEAAMDEFQQQLVLGFGMDLNNPEALKLAQESHSIDKLLAQVQRDQAVIQMLESVFDTGLKTAAEFFEPLKMATSGKEFIKNAILAVRRTQEFLEWQALNAQALDACSVQGFAFANRVRNLKVQLSKKVLDAVFELAQLSGAAASCATLGAGAAVSKGAKALQTLTNLIYEYGQKADLRRQWSNYKECLKNPYDRTLMREVLHKNPTLSKYAMAYAAVEEDDVIAKQGMKQCGINEETLKHPDTNAMKVVTFLEAKFVEDPKLIRKLEKKNWQSAENDLAFGSWASNKKSAKTAIDLADSSTGGVDAAIMALESSQQALDDHKLQLTRSQKTFDAAQGLFIEPYEAYTRGLETFTDGVTLYGPMQESLNEAIQLYDQVSEHDEQAVAEHVEQLQSYLATVEGFVQRGKTTLAAIEPFRASVATFSLAAQTYLDVTSVSTTMDTVVANAEKLIQQLGKYTPLNSEGKPCEDFQEYCEGLAIKSNMAARAAKEERDAYLERVETVRLLKKEAEAYSAEVNSKKSQVESQLDAWTEELTRIRTRRRVVVGDEKANDLEGDERRAEVEREEQRLQDEAQAQEKLVEEITQLIAAQPNTLKGDLKNVSFVYYEKLTLPPTEKLKYPLMFVNTKSETYKAHSDGKCVTATIVEKGTGLLSRNKYFRYSGGLTQKEVFDALVNTGWDLKNLTKPEHIEKV